MSEARSEPWLSDLADRPGTREPLGSECLASLLKGEWRPVGERTEFPGVSIRHTDSRRPPLLPVLLDALKLLSMAWEVLPPRQQPADETTQAEG